MILRNILSKSEQRSLRAFLPYGIKKLDFHENLYVFVNRNYAMLGAPVSFDMPFDNSGHGMTAFCHSWMAKNNIGFPLSLLQIDLLEQIEGVDKVGDGWFFFSDKNSPSYGDDLTGKKFKRYMGILNKVNAIIYNPGNWTYLKSKKRMPKLPR